MMRPGFQCPFPFRGFLSYVFSKIIFYQHIPDIADVDFVPVDLLGIVFQIFLHIIKQLLDLQSMSREPDFLSIPEQEINCGIRSRRLRVQRVEPAPRLGNLLITFLFPIVMPGSEPFNAVHPARRCGVILSAVFIYLSQRIGRVFSVSLVLVGRYFLVYTDKPGIFRQRKPFDSRCQPRNRFVIF